MGERLVGTLETVTELERRGQWIRVALGAYGCGSGRFPFLSAGYYFTLIFLSYKPV